MNHWLPVPWQELGMRFAEHVQLTFTAVLAAVALGIPLGVWCARSPRANRIVMPVIHVVQTIPGLAMLAFLLPFLGIGFAPAICALILYSVLPVTRNTIAGLTGLNPSYEEAAASLGTSPVQSLIKVGLPLAAPVILAGIRTAAVWSVGLATLAAFIGAGGLGDFINRGLALDNTALLLTGAIPAALLAIMLDGLLARVERLSHARLQQAIPWVLAAIIGILLVVPALKYGKAHPPLIADDGTATGKLRVGTKNWSEQIIIGEIVAQLAEEKYGVPVERRFGFGSTDMISKALQKGEIDFYPEYTGTIWSVLLKEETAPAQSPGQMALLAEACRSQLGLEIVADLGFSNTYALAVREEDARKEGWRTISDLARSADTLRAGFNSEFAGRADGWPALRAGYGLAFKEVATLDAMLVYEALRSGKVDVASVFSTDGRIGRFNLVLLEDDRRIFPDYTCVLLSRKPADGRAVLIENLGKLLTGRLTQEKVREMNAAVDVDKKTPAAVAREFLVEEGLIPEKVKLLY